MTWAALVQDSMELATNLSVFWQSSYANNDENLAWSCVCVCVLLLFKIFFWSATYRMHAYAHIDNTWHTANFLNDASRERNSTESTCLEAAHCCTKTLQVPLHLGSAATVADISHVRWKEAKKGPDVNKALPAFLMTMLSSWQWNQLVRNRQTNENFTASLASWPVLRMHQPHGNEAWVALSDLPGKLDSVS